MYKKLIMACMAFAAFAAFAASSASANPVLTHPTGTVLGAGAAITATNVGESEMSTPLGPVLCDHNDMSGTIHSNSTASGVKGEITSASFNGKGTNTDCTGPGSGSTKVTVTGLPWCVESPTSKDTFVVRGGGCTAGVNEITFTLDLTSGFECGYSKPSVGGTATTDTSGADAQLTVTGEKVLKSSGGFFCPSEGTLNMTFTLETTNGTAVYLSS